MQEPKYFFKFTEFFNDDGTVWYTIQVHTKGEDQEPIIFKSRYSEMRDIHDRCASTAFKNDLPDFPQKKLIGSTKQQFVQKRKKELENYYNTLAKTIDFQKLKVLHDFIESHRKIKKPQPKTNKGMDESGNIESKLKKQAALRNAFQTIYKEVSGQFINLIEDGYPDEFQEQLVKFESDLQKIKPKQSKILTATVQGLEKNDEDFWAVTFSDNHDDFMRKTAGITDEFKAIEDDLRRKSMELNPVTIK